MREKEAGGTSNRHVAGGESTGFGGRQVWVHLTCNSESQLPHLEEGHRACSSGGSEDLKRQLPNPTRSPKGGAEFKVGGMLSSGDHRCLS